MLYNWKGYTHHLVAVKTLKGRFSLSDVKRLAEESQIMAGFDHPNVMKLLGVSSISGSKTLFIIMPFMAHGSLFTYLRKNRADFTVENEELVFNLSSMIDLNNVIKVADFGQSEDIYAGNYFRQTTEQDEDGEPPVKLPVKWMALGSLNDGIFSKKTDVWSFGVTC
ncbi:Tyrosine-protein kinase receptor TYRO3 [Geodia barretti]|uniref:Tyrosine-protein kinase receptor TYRO3 n=1 Tax=Geodia barretti TaxID=519541 RepID=A0AA35RIG4_GEOBA|nr:Tyrosine-protein kinase receptor TYRO3 [Geodia barretti]